jgi:hypothetical protein
MQGACFELTTLPHYDGERHPVCTRLQTRLRGHCVKAARLTLQVRVLAALAEDQEPESASGEREAEEDWGR